LMAKNIYNRRAAGLLKSAVETETPRWNMSTMIPGEGSYPAQIYRSQPSIECDL
jgi:hypothetical protein